MLSIPNLLTLSRILAVPILVFLLWRPTPVDYAITFVLYCMVGITDYFDGGPMDIVMTGDDDEAKAVVLDLFRASPWRFLDGGGLAQARFTERMTLFAGQLAAKYGYLPRVGWRLLGEPWDAGVNDAYGDIIQRWDAPPARVANDADLLVPQN